MERGSIETLNFHGKLVGVTAMNFLNSPALGPQYENDLFVGDINHGRLYHFDSNQDRTGLMLEGVLRTR